MMAAVSDKQRPRRPLPVQFRLQTLFVLFVFVWSSMAAFGLGGIFLAGFLLPVAFLIRRQRDGFITPLGCAVIAIVVAVTFLLLFAPASRAPRGPHRLGYCMNNMKQIAMALQSYQSTNGKFPPAYIADEDGKPMHSWRVFGCPAAEGGRTTTSYVAVVGPRTAWLGEKSQDIMCIYDGSSATILLVEVADSDICWMEPRDLSLDDVLSGDPQRCRALTSHHVGDGYFCDTYLAGSAAFADGSVHFFPGRPKREDLEALLTVDGGEPIDRFRLNLERPPGRINWPHCIGLPIFLISYALLLRKAWAKRPESRNA